ncbi:MAG: glycosyltransferase, partial [Chloroflexi bacterium]|nr:glycosyltransferase [Chloroflexota bacterium]
MPAIDSCSRGTTIMHHNRVKLSVIIPTLNRHELLRDAIASVRSQTFPTDQYEIIVVDNGSTDGTRELVERVNQDGGKPIRYVYEPRP